MQAASNSRPRITVIIPTLNEARNLPRVFPRLPQDLHEVIVVDGNSVDGTLAAARRLRPDARVIVQDSCGKGNALACGFAAATGDIIVVLDADGSADPAEIPRFVSVLVAGADFAKGARSDGGGPGPPGFRRAANRVLNATVNALCHTGYSDPCYGFNAFWRRHAPLLGLDGESSAKGDGRTRLRGSGFEVDTLISLRAARAGLTIKEVASSQYSRSREAGSLPPVTDGVRILFSIVSEQRRSRRRGGSATALMVLLGADL